MIRKFIATLSLAIVLSLAGPVIGTKPALARSGGPPRAAGAPHDAPSCVSGFE
jgi:hypothetical protein